MIKPEDVKMRNENIHPYEAQIDEILRAAWTEEMKHGGRKVSLCIPPVIASASGVLPNPSAEQRDKLRRVYQGAGWIISDDSKQSDVWVFTYPKGKTP